MVRFLPPQVETTAQGTMTVALIIENAADVSSAPLQVSYDPKVVKLNDAGRGDFFSSDGQIPVFTKNIQNDAGAAAMNLNRLPNTPGRLRFRRADHADFPGRRQGLHHGDGSQSHGAQRAGAGSLLGQPADDD